jgi:Delta7-sterol 5-desaturase
MGFDPRKLL